MKQIQDFLNRFKNLKAPERSVKRAVIDAVKESASVQLREFELSLGRGVVFITTNPIVKSEIMLNRAGVLRLLREKGFGNEVRELR